MTQITRSPGLLAMLALFFLLPAALDLPVILIGDLYNFSLFAKTLAMLAVSSAGCLIAYAKWAKAAGWPSLRRQFAPISRWAELNSLAAAIVMLMLFVSLSAILDGIGIELRAIPTPDFRPADWRQLLPCLPILVLLVPYYEELLFRGIFLEWLRQRLPAPAAIVVSSLAFALAHDNNLSLGLSGWLQFAERTAIGCVLAVLALRYRSLRAPFIMHATHNAIVGSLPVLIS
jgi:membrane protease YdiL (CAAX protease family)